MLGRRPRPESERFFTHTAPVGEPDECHLWVGTRDKNGYGMFGIKRDGRWTGIAAHRWAYEHFVGPIGDLEVCHTCDNPSCWNIRHLFLATHGENMADCRAKQRHACGEAVHFAVLTEADVLSIRERHRSGTVSQAKLATEYGVRRHTIMAIVHRRTWRHLP